MLSTFPIAAATTYDHEEVNMKTQNSKQITELDRIAVNIVVFEKVENNAKTIWTTLRRSGSHNFHFCC